MFFHTPAEDKTQRARRAAIVLDCAQEVRARDAGAYEISAQSQRSRLRNSAPTAGFVAGTPFALPVAMQLRVAWDRERSIANLRDHGVSFAEAATVFGDPFSRTIADPRWAVADGRFVTLGLSQRARTLVVSHLDRGTGVWILSARCAIQKAAARTRRTSDSEGRATPTERHNFANGRRGQYAARYWEAAARGRLPRT
jgi:uncharacterized DUF497 family protein